jgi:FKBP-type peptidyl-prolyl cis-trans isomerase
MYSSVQEVVVPKRISLWLLTGLVLLAAVSAAGCGAKTESTTPSSQEPAQTEPAAPQQAAPAAPAPTAQDVTELKVEDLTVGKGAEAKNGDLVTVHYTGWLTDGTKFDSSVDKGQPYQFTLGAGKVIPGWDEGVAGMKVGGKRKLTIPPDMGYGAQGAGGVIPPNATLVFEVELLGIN